MALLPPLPVKYKGRAALCAAALVAFVAAAVYGDHGLMHLLRMHREQRRLEQRIFALEQRNEQLHQRIQRLQADDHYIEQLARERLGLVKPGEIIYRVAPTPPAR
jgi:cell division protein FtsB